MLKIRYVFYWKILKKKARSNMQFSCVEITLCFALASVAAPGCGSRSLQEAPYEERRRPSGGGVR